MRLAVTFLGVAPSALLPLAVGLLGATVLLYVLRLRRRPLIVPFAELWQKQLGDKYASRLRSRLRRILSLLLQLALLALIVLSLSDPRPDSYGKPAESIVLLVDVSASMGAPRASDGTTTRLDAAKTEAQRILETLGPRDEVLLIELSDQPAPLTSWTADRERTREAVSALRPKDVVARPDAALSVATDALAGRSRGRAVLLTDGALPPLDAAQVEALSLTATSVIQEDPTRGSGETGPSSALPNVAISAFSARRYPYDSSRFEVLLELANTGTDPAEVEVHLHGVRQDMRPGPTIDVWRTRLPGGESQSHVVSDLSAVEQGLWARVSRVDGGGNWLLADDTARALLTKRPATRVLVVGPANTFLDAALLLDPNLEVRRIDASTYPPAEPSDIVIFDGVSARRKAHTGAALYLGPGDAERDTFPVEVGATLSMFGFDSWKKESPLFRFLDPYDIQVLHGRALVAGPQDQVLGRSGRDPILISGQDSAGRFLALGFNPRDSDFVLRAAFPLFLSNVLAELAPLAQGEAGQGVATGKGTPLHAGTEHGHAILRGPLGGSDEVETRLSVRHGRVTVRPALAGFYTLSDPAQPRLVAANFFDRSEATTPGRPAVVLSTGESLGPTPRPVREATQEVGWRTRILPRTPIDPWMWLLLGVLTISCIEWWTYHRRWTV